MPPVGTLIISVGVQLDHVSKLKTVHIERELPEWQAREFFARFKEANPHIAGLVAKWETRQVVFM